MSESGLHIDTRDISTTSAEDEQYREDVKHDSGKTLPTALESPSEESDESDVFDNSDKTIPELSPTTPIQPEHHDIDFKVEDVKISTVEIVEPEMNARTVSQESSRSEETDPGVEHLSEEPVQETPILTLTETQHCHDVSDRDPPTPEPSQKFEEEAGFLSTDPESFEEKDMKEEQARQKPESSIAGADEAFKEIIPDFSHPTGMEPKTVLGEQIQKSPDSDENPLGELADKELPESSSPAAVVEAGSTTQRAIQTISLPSQDKDPIASTAPTSPLASKDASKPIPSSRENSAFDEVKRSRNQFRVALDVFLQLIINENEDDEGIVRLNLAARDSDLRRAVEMLGLKLRGLVEAERDLDHVKLVTRYEAKKAQED